MKPIYKLSLWLIAAGILLWLFVPQWRAIVAGLLLGMLVSLLNSWYLGKKIGQLSTLIADGTRKRFNLGFLTRVSTAILAVMYAMKSDHADLGPTIIGLFYSSAVILIWGILSRITKRND
jgi:ATP synthase protein I